MSRNDTSPSTWVVAAQVVWAMATCAACTGDDKPDARGADSLEQDTSEQASTSLETSAEPSEPATHTTEGPVVAPTDEGAATGEAASDEPSGEEGSSLEPASEEPGADDSASDVSGNSGALEPSEAEPSEPEPSESESGSWGDPDAAASPVTSEPSDVDATGTTSEVESTLEPEDTQTEAGRDCDEGEEYFFPGCGVEPNLLQAGCYRRCTGADDLACPEGSSCQEADINPCVCENVPPGGGCCAACGQALWLCQSEAPGASR